MTTILHRRGLRESGYARIVWHSRYRQSCGCHGPAAEDGVAVLLLLASPDEYDPTTAGMLVLAPVGVRLRDLCAAFSTENGFAVARPEVADMVRAAVRLLAAETACMDQARRPRLSAAYDREMKLVGSDGGDSLRQYVADLGSTRLRSLAGQAGTPPYGSRGPATVCLSRQNVRFPASPRRDPLPGGRAAGASPWRFNPGRDFSGLQPHHGVRRCGLADRRGELRRVGRGPAERDSDGAIALGKRYCAGRGGGAGVGLRGLEGPEDPLKQGLLEGSHDTT
jgi:hypothetical protein